MMGRTSASIFIPEQMRSPQVVWSFITDHSLVRVADYKWIRSRPRVCKC
jgi:hypothetical protein